VARCASGACCCFTRASASLARRSCSCRGLGGELRLAKLHPNALDGAACHAYFLLEDALPRGVDLLDDPDFQRPFADRQVDRTFALEHAVDRDLGIVGRAVADDAKHGLGRFNGLSGGLLRLRRGGLQRKAASRDAAMAVDGVFFMSMVAARLSSRCRG
jgi:hypothetical protein